MTRHWLKGPQQPCARCGALTHSVATPPLHRRCKPQAAPRGEASWTERNRRAAAVRQHIEEFGYLCPGWQRPPHMATPPGGRNALTADHIISVAQGGAESGPLQVLCRSCNSGKRERSGIARPLPAAEPTTYSPSRMWTQVYPSPSGTC